MLMIFLQKGLSFYDISSDVCFKHLKTKKGITIFFLNQLLPTYHPPPIVNKKIFVIAKLIVTTFRQLNFENALIAAKLSYRLASLLSTVQFC